DRATVTLGVPASITSVACSAGPPGSRLTCARASARGLVATFSQTNLAAGTGLTIFVGPPSRSIVPDPQPILERRRTLNGALAVRGWLTITDLDGDYELTATQAAGKGTLLPYETALMNALFGAGPEVKLSDLKYKFRAELAQIQDAMYDDVVAQGWYRIRPDRTRQRWVLIAVGFLVVAVAATVIVALGSSFGLVPVGFVLGAITLLAVASHMPSRTGKGSAMFSRVRGFRRLFGEGDQGLREQFAEPHEILPPSLPY